MDFVSKHATLGKDEWQMIPGYWCVVCGRFIPAKDGVVVHDSVPHPILMFHNYDERLQ